MKLLVGFFIITVALHRNVLADSDCSVCNDDLIISDDVADSDYDVNYDDGGNSDDVDASDDVVTPDDVGTSDDDYISDILSDVVFTDAVASDDSGSISPYEVSDEPLLPDCISELDDSGPDPALDASEADLNNSDADAFCKVVLPEPAITCNCLPQYNPVCGSDGNTYGNPCQLKCNSDARRKRGSAEVNIKYNGVCPVEPCPCKLVYKPVCGNDGFTHYNPCFLDCKNARREKYGLKAITILHEGPCKKIRICHCPDTVIPVCGTDNVTYRNFCYLHCASYLKQLHGLPPIFFQNAGPCKTEYCPCPKIFKPVCASNDQTFDNQCLLDCENRRRKALGQKPLNVKHNGICCKCPGTWDPVCASDGKTYRNACILKCLNANRIKNGLKPFIIQHKGICGCNCKRNYDPVCGSDGKTYSNICLLYCEIKRRLYLGLKPIKLAYHGQCICTCNHCSVFFNPVCGSNGKTYWNYCWLKCHSDCNEKKNLPKINFVNFGYC